MNFCIEADRGVALWIILSVTEVGLSDWLDIGDERGEETEDNSQDYELDNLMGTHN